MRIHQDHGHGSHPDGLARLCAGENHVFHAGAAQALADCSPSTQLMASLRLDLPHPLGPTTAAIPPPLKRSSVRSQNDLKPWSSTFLSFSKTSTPYSRLGGERHHTNVDRDKSKVADILDSVSISGRALHIAALTQKRRHAIPPDFISLICFGVSK